MENVHWVHHFHCRFLSASQDSNVFSLKRVKGWNSKVLQYLTQFSSITAVTFTYSCVINNNTFSTIHAIGIDSTNCHFSLKVFKTSKYDEMTFYSDYKEICVETSLHINHFRTIVFNVTHVT